MTASVHKDLSEKQAKFRLDDPNFVSEVDGTTDAKLLKV